MSPAEASIHIHKCAHVSAQVYLKEVFPKLNICPWNDCEGANITSMSHSEWTVHLRVHFLTQRVQAVKCRVDDCIM